MVHAVGEGHVVLGGGPAAEQVLGVIVRCVTVHPAKGVAGVVGMRNPDLNLRDPLSLDQESCICLPLCHVLCWDVGVAPADDGGPLFLHSPSLCQPQ